MNVQPAGPELSFLLNNRRRKNHPASARIKWHFLWTFPNHYSNLNFIKVQKLLDIHEQNLKRKKYIIIIIIIIIIYILYTVIKKQFHELTYPRFKILHKFELYEKCNVQIWYPCCSQAKNKKIYIFLMNISKILQQFGLYESSKLLDRVIGHPCVKP